MEGSRDESQTNCFRKRGLPGVRGTRDSWLHKFLVAQSAPRTLTFPWVPLWHFRYSDPHGIRGRVLPE